MKVDNGNNVGSNRSINDASRANVAERMKRDQRSDRGVSGAAIYGGAKPEISDRAKSMAQAKSLASSAPETREAKIEELRRRIAEGKYRVDADAVADRMVNDHLRTREMGL